MESLGCVHECFPAESVPPSSSGVAVVTGCVPKPMEPGCAHESVPAERVPPSSSGVAVVTGCVPKPMESPGCVHEGVPLSPSFSGGEIDILTAV